MTIASMKDDSNGLVAFLCCSIISCLSSGADVWCRNAFGACGAPGLLVSVLHKLCAHWYFMQSHGASTGQTTGSEDTHLSSSFSRGTLLQTTSSVVKTLSRPRRQSMMSSLAAAMPSMGEINQPPSGPVPSSSIIQPPLHCVDLTC